MKKAKKDTIASLKARIAKLENDKPLIKIVTKLNIGKDDLLVFQTDEIVPDYQQQRLTNQLGEHFGHRVSILFARKTEVKVVRKAK